LFAQLPEKEPAKAFKNVSPAQQASRKAGKPAVVREFQGTETVLRIGDVRRARRLRADCRAAFYAAWRTARLSVLGQKDRDTGHLVRAAVRMLQQSRPGTG
jgi:hypothetical protein